MPRPGPKTAQRGTQTPLARSLNEVPDHPKWQEPFDEAICWRGGTEAQWQRHNRRGEPPCRNCMDAQARAALDRKGHKR